LRTDSAPERRRAARRKTAADEPLSQIRLRAGGELTVIDVSDAGLLAEGATRLLPGTHVDVHLVTRDGRLLVRSRIIRAFVCHVSAAGIRYRGALMFDRSVDTTAVGYAIPGALIASTSLEGSAYPPPPTIR
jgi:hypothetical protein